MSTSSLELWVIWLNKLVFHSKGMMLQLSPVSHGMSPGNLSLFGIIPLGTSGDS